LLAELAAGIGVPDDVCDDIRAAETARYAGERIEALGRALILSGVGQ